MVRLSTFIFALIFVFLLSCTAYKSHDYELQIEKIHSIAILPMEIIHTGKKPTNMSEQEMQIQDNEERITFQKTIFEATSTHQSQRNIRIQSPNETIARLEQSQINIYAIEKYSIKELGDALGVDAVVSSSLTKRRYRGDNESMVIDLAQTVQRETVNRPLPQISIRTNEINLNVSMVDTKEGHTIWADNRRGQVNWSSSLDLMMDEMSRNLVRTMPRKKR